MLEAGAAGARLRGDPGRRRQYRAAGSRRSPTCGRQAYVGTPDFLKVLLDAAAKSGKRRRRRSSAAWCRARPCRRRCAQNCRRAASTCCSATRTAETGVIAYETSSARGPDRQRASRGRDRRPGTGDPVPDGEVGEVVVTSFNPDYPMIRLATGDLSAVLPGVSPCGRTNMRIKGWMGRADQTTKVKGMFVHPEQVAEVAKRHPEARPCAPRGDARTTSRTR